MNNVVNYLKRAAEMNPSRTAIVVPAKGGAQSISYSELWDDIDRFATALCKRGLKPRDRVIIMIPMSVELYIAMLGIIKMGGVAVFADPWVPISQIIKFCKFASPKGFIGIGKSHLLRFWDQDLRKISITITTGYKWVGLIAGNTFDEMLKNTGNTEVHNADMEDSALITFTTGSTGTPKGANRTHGFLNAQKKALDHEFPIEDSDIDMPMFPVFALRNLANGIPSIIPDIDFKSVATVDGKKIFRQIKEYKVNTITASPPFFDKLASYVLKKQAFELPLRRLLTGGAPVHDFQLKKWRKAFSKADVQIVYGSTEAEPVAHISLEDRLNTDSKAGFCSGKPTSLVKTKIIEINKGSIAVDKTLDDLALEDGEVGELIVTGKHVCKDYFNNPQAVEENKIIDKDGAIWHRMGDTGYFDKNGRFWLIGRIHSTICRKGKQYHPQIIEEIARYNDKRIKNIAVLGVADGFLGEKLILVVESQEKNSLKMEIKQRLEDNQIPVDDIIIRNASLPLDPRHNSKIDYNKLRKMLK